MFHRLKEFRIYIEKILYEHYLSGNYDYVDMTSDCHISLYLLCFEFVSW